MNKFGEASLERLGQCNDRIQLVCYKAILVADFAVITGHRNKEAQNKLYPKYTRVKWPDSKHNKNPSQAIDVAPYIEPYGTIYGSKADVKKIMKLSNVSEKAANAFIIKAYSRLIGIMEGIAAENDVEIRVGLDWDGDMDMLDQTFHDLGHWETV
jgi:peptidoglycan L-alanyl-D-glutamate endopeptidase CwlK